MQVKNFHPVKRVSAIFLTLLLASVVVPTQAQKFKVLHTFHGPNGNGPAGVLARDAAGNLYGTTEAGGSGKCGNFGCGTAFKLNKAGKQIWLHSFSVADGEEPSAGMLRDVAGNLFGTTLLGGRITKACGGVQSGGCGAVFKLDKTGKETVLYKFKGTPDGNWPEALLVEDGSGNLYGTTYVGGASGVGAIFKVDKAGKETVLYSFTGGSDGCYPRPGVILDTAGNLYGVTSVGGVPGFCAGDGVVFKLDTSDNETVLHAFGGGDGAIPDSVLLFDAEGNLYGTTGAGGSGECGGTGCGTVFELSPQSDGKWTETVLYVFCSLSGCVDGEEPSAGPLVRDSKGNLYGTTVFGGTSRNCNGSGCGTVFKLDTSGKETVLHSFTGGSDGVVPVAGLTTDASGNLYGVALQGGDNSCNPAHGCGTVFRIVP